MKRWKKVLAAVVLAALALGLLIPASGSAANVNLMAVNERVLVTTVENMPRTVGDVLYVPYTMLSSRSTNIDLGVSAMYSNTRRRVLVTDGRRGVTFDLQSNSAQDLDGTPVSARAMVHNTMVFIPIDWICQYFGTISCTRTRSPYGTVIRITNRSAILSDRDFVDSADTQLSNSLANYLASGGGNEDDEPIPSESAEESDPPSGAELFLALCPGARVRECVQLLEGREQRVLFLFTREELEQEGDLVRRIVGAGHTVGLALTGEDLDSCLAEAEQGRALLAAAARYNVLVVSAPNLDNGELEVLQEQGVVVWSATVRGEDFSTGAALVRGLSTRRVNFVEIACDAEGLALLRSALNAMEEENCQIYQATAPALA